MCMNKKEVKQLVGLHGPGWVLCALVGPGMPHLGPLGPRAGWVGSDRHNVSLVGPTGLTWVRMSLVSLAWAWTDPSLAGSDLTLDTSRINAEPKDSICDLQHTTVTAVNSYY